MMGPTGQEMAYLTLPQDSHSKLSRFTKTHSSEPATRKEAREWFDRWTLKFHSAFEGEGFNNALYGYTKDCTRYFMSMGHTEEQSWDLVLEAVMSHPCYETWGEMDEADETTFQSAFDACLDSGDYWDLPEDLEEIADDFDPFNPAPVVLETEVLKHLWQDKMLSGAVGILSGDGGVGKSTLLMKVAAKLSRGTLPGYYLGEKGYSIFYAMEDHRTAVFNPRLLASGADPTYVRYMGKGSKEGLQFPRDIEVLEREIARYKGLLRLVVFDPLEAYMVANSKTNESKDVAELMHSLNNLAADWNLTILGVKHNNKAPDLSLRDRISGSKGFVNHARFVLSAGHTDTFEDDGTCSVGIIKSNAIDSRVPALLYQIKSTTFVPTMKEKRLEEGTTTYCQFVGDSEHGQEVVQAKRAAKDRSIREDKHEKEDTSKSQQARLWIVQLLNKQGPLTFSEIKEHRESSQSAPTQTTLERSLRDYKKDNTYHFRDNKYMTQAQGIKDLIELEGKLPDGVQLPGQVYDGVTRHKPTRDGIIKLKEYQARTDDGLLDAYLESK